MQVLLVYQSIETVSLVAGLLPFPEVFEYVVLCFSKVPEVFWFLLQHSEVVDQLGQPLFVV